MKDESAKHEKSESKAVEDGELLAEITSFRESADGYWGEIWNQYTNDVKFSRKGEQWEPGAAKAREDSGRPCLTFNKIPAYMRQVTNESRMNKPAIVVKPADDDADVETALIINGLIRSIENSSNSDYAYDTAIDNTVAGGLGYIFITTDYVDDMSFEQDIRMKRCVNPLVVKFDPMSTEPDGSDAMACVVEEIVRRSEFKNRYPKAEIDGYNDAAWGDKDNITVCQYWKVSLVDDTLLLLSDNSAILKSVFDEELEMQEFYTVAGITVTEKSRPIKRRQVTQYVTNGKEILQTNKWAGKYIPIVPVYGEEVWDGETRAYKSLHRDAQDAQRMYNYFRTSSTESVALQIRSPYLGKTGTFDTDATKWANANTTNYSFIEYDNEMPQRQGWIGVDQGSLQEAMNASEDLKAIMGIYDASLGARSNETSGIAIAQRKSQAGVSTYHFTDNLSRAIRQCGRIIVDLIPHIYDTPRIIRIIGEDGKTEEQVAINQQTIRKNRAAMFDVSVGKYDVVVDTGASFTTRREEVAAQIDGVIRAYPQGAPMLMDILAENSDWPKADKVAKRFALMLPPEIRDSEQGGDEQDPEQLMQAHQQMGQQLQQAEEAIDHLKQQLMQTQQQQQEREDQLNLAMEQEKNKGKYIDLQREKEKTAQKEAELMADQIPVFPVDRNLTY